MTTVEVEVLICRVGTCPEPAQPEHSPCCSVHGAKVGEAAASFCCEHYCNSHFVEVHRCSADQHAATKARLAEERAARKAAAS